MSNISEIKSRVMEILTMKSVNILPSLCQRYGLIAGSVCDGESNKRVYIENLLASKDNEFIINMADKVFEDFNEDCRSILSIEPVEIGTKIQVFISHLTADKDYTEVITNILIGIGIKNDCIFCSSIPGQGIPLGEGFPEKIKNSLIDAKLIIFIFSQEFYYSIYCCNEMGAAWVLGKDIIPVLIPPISPSDMKGFIDNTRYQAAVINNVSNLNDLYDKVISIFKLKELKANQWENIKRDSLSKIDIKMKNAKTYTQATNSVVDFKSIRQLIDLNKLSTNEILLVAYISDTENRHFGVRWMAEETIENIKVWENKNSISEELSQNYYSVIDNFAERDFLKPTEYTSYGNPRKFVMPIAVYDDLKELDDEEKSKINEVLNSLSSF